MKASFIIILLFWNISKPQPVSEGNFCESNADCLTSCCYDSYCRSMNTCAVYNLAKKKVVRSTCSIDSHCPTTNCCLGSQCVAYQECFNLYTLPVILGLVLGVSLFLLMFASVYIYTEYKKGADGKFGLFRQEVLAEDKLITDQFPHAKTREEIIQEEIATEVQR